jgi:hypothetical protein
VGSLLSTMVVSGGRGEAAGEHQDRWYPATDVPDTWKGSSRPKKACMLRFHGELALKCCSPAEIVVEMMLIRTRISGRWRLQITYI